MAIEIVDGLVILIYLAVIVGVGFYASTKIKSSADYAVAGRSMKFPVLCGTLIGTTIGAAATMGKAGKAYEAGFAVLYASIAYMLGYVLMAFFASRLRAANIDSMPDVLQRRYGKTMRVVGAVILLLTAIPVVGIQLSACGLIVTQFLPDLGISFTGAVVIAALVIVVYTLLGGLLAVAFTDLMQVGIMFLGIGIMLPLLLLFEVGDLDALKAVLVSPVEGWLGGLDLAYTLSFFPVFTAIVLIDPSVWQRIAAAKCAEDLRPAMFLTAGFFGFWSVLVVGLGVVAFNLYPGLSEADLAIPQMIVDYMPPVLKGICLAAIIALIMSTGDSMLLICGTTVSWDIVRVLRPGTQDKTLLLISRLVILVIGIVSVFFALLRIPLFEVNFMALGIFVSGLFMPVMGAIFYRHATTIGAVCATALGAGSFLGLQLMQFGLGITPPVQPILVGLGLGVVIYFIVCKFTWSADTATSPALARQ
ncbi:putative transporter, SSS family [marine gamma proteobacterium HTCC2148]|nr:putative transporter, SSS family [marine gamma proteobacterium HTCC2148]